MGIITVSGLQEIEIHDVDLQFGHCSVRVDRGRSARGAASACPFSAKPLAEASGSRERCYLQGLTALTEEHAAAQWAQSELFFRLLLKNTVCPLHQAAYAYFWRVLPLCEEGPTIQFKFVGLSRKWAKIGWFLRNPTIQYSN